MADPNRARLIKLVHTGARALGMDEDSRRAMMERLTGKRSAGDMNTAELEKVVAEMRGKGFTPKAGAAKKSAAPAPASEPNRLGPKIRALWISLYELGVIGNSGAAPLDTFVHRQTGVAALLWITPEKGDSVIEALKAMATRDAGVDWSPYRKSVAPGQTVAIEKPRLRVMEAQWRRLAEAGAVRIADSSALWGWAEKHLKSNHRISPMEISDADADSIIRELGAWLRRARAAQREKSDAG